MASSTTIDIPTRIDDLAALYVNLASALTEAGVNGSQLNQVLSSSFQASCTRCSIHITGEEIHQITLVDDPTQLPHPKLKRLRLGYCARDGCESEKYSIHLEPHAGLDWDKVIARTNVLRDVQQAAAKETERHRARHNQIQKTKRTVLALGILILSLLLWFVWRHGRLPFVKKTPKYQIDPASVSPGPRP